MDGLQNSDTISSKKETASAELPYDKALHPTWGGVNFRTAEVVCFAAQAQLLHDYNSSVHAYQVSGGVLSAWTNWSHSGEARRDGTPDGLGKAALFGGIMNYTGNFRQGLMHGQGKLEFINGVVYEGQFSYNCIHGAGTYRWINGAHYSGEVLDGLPHGSGILQTATGPSCVYSGSWMNGLRHGKGNLTYGKEGETVYYGEWENDCKHGQGNLVYKSGSTYRGVWFGGKRQGTGHAVLVTESVVRKPDVLLMHMHWRLDAKAVQIYNGEWKNDFPHGSGTDIWADDGVEENTNILRNMYEGNFLEGKRSGHGSFYYATGAIFTGTWNDNMKEGAGALIYEDGTLHSGSFYRDRYLPVSSGTVEKEALSLLIEVDSDYLSMKRRVVDIFRRCNTKLIEIFFMYSYFPMKSSDETKISYYGRARALLLEQLWHFCHDIKFVHPSFGLAQLDFMLRASLHSWDKSSDVHFPKRQFIYREFLEVIIKLARVKYAKNIPLDIKVSSFLEAEVLNLDVCDCKSLYVLVSSGPVQNVFEDYKIHMQQLFSNTMREVGTSDGTIKILYLLSFFARFGPDLVADQQNILAKIISGLYYKAVSEDDDINDYLERDINSRECELCILLISMEDKTMPEAEPQQMLRKTLNEVVIPNLSTSLDVLLSEPAPSTSKKGKKK